MTHQSAYNEFIADFVERHGKNQATRDEAHEWADKIVEIARSVNDLRIKYAVINTTAQDEAADFVAAMINDLPIDNKEEARFLAACVK